MKWTSDLPTVPGVYWFKSDRHALTICEVFEYQSHGSPPELLVGFRGDEDSCELTGWGPEAKWYGPIEPPKDE